MGHGAGGAVSLRGKAVGQRRGAEGPHHLWGGWCCGLGRQGEGSAGVWFCLGPRVQG